MRYLLRPRFSSVLAFRSPLCLGVREFRLPDIGEGIAEVEVMQWFVKPGDKVTEMDKLCVVESDKATVEITSRYTGSVVSLFADVNTKAKVGSVLLTIDDPNYTGDGKEAGGHGHGHGHGASVPPKVQPSTASQAVKTPTAGHSSHASQATHGSQGQASGQSKAVMLPSIRKLAETFGLNPDSIQGTGPGGRVTEQDIMNAKRVSFGKEPKGAAPAGGRPGQGQAQAAPAPKLTSDQIVRPNSVVSAMIKSMTLSAQIPQMCLVEKVSVKNLESLLPSFRRTAQDKIGYTALFVKAISLAAQEYPILNSELLNASEGSTSEPSIKLIADHNVSVAIDVPGKGLIVPNIKKVQSKSVAEVQKDLSALIDRASKNATSLDDIKGGTISISNVGSIGGLIVKPLLMPPQSAIIGFGRIEEGHVHISVSADHRHLDGATVARFVGRLKQLIEEPGELGSNMI